MGGGSPRRLQGTRSLRGGQPRPCYRGRVPVCWPSGVKQQAATDSTRQQPAATGGRGPDQRPDDGRASQPHIGPRATRRTVSNPRVLGVPLRLFYDHRSFHFSRCRRRLFPRSQSAFRSFLLLCAAPSSVSPSACWPGHSGHALCPRTPLARLPTAAYLVKWAKSVSRLPPSCAVNPSLASRLAFFFFPPVSKSSLPSFCYGPSAEQISESLFLLSADGTAGRR